MDLKSFGLTAACAGALGFFLGRQSADVHSVVATTVTAPSGPSSANASVSNSVSVDLSRQEVGKLLSRRPETQGNAPLNPNTLAKKMSLKDIDWNGKRVLVRVDYNVPIKDGVVTDATRIESTLPTLNHLLTAGKPKCLVLIAHLGQPVGVFAREDYTLAPAAVKLQQLLGRPVRFLNECVGPAVEDAIATCEPGTVFLLENLRFHLEEIGDGKNDKKEKIKARPEDVAEFRRLLSRLGDVYIFEAFGAAHRPHSSIVGIDIPQRVCGLLMQKELEYFARVLGAPKRPFVAILGGSKISDKLLVIENLLEQCDHLIVGGGMAYTFLKVAHNVRIGNSLFDAPGAEHVPQILAKAAARNVTIHLPHDHVIADQFDEKARVGVTDDKAGIPDGWMALDIGPASRARFSAVLAHAQTVLWNGPMGVFEKGPFAAGTLSVMVDCVLASKRGACAIIGGGDTGAASNRFYFGTQSCAQQVSHVSTGGGSSLVLMEGKALPGVQALSDLP